MWPFDAWTGTEESPVVVQPRGAQTPEEEAAFRAFGFDPAEKQMPAVIADWVSRYRNSQAENKLILPIVNPAQADAATGKAEISTPEERMNALASSGGLTGFFGKLGLGAQKIGDRIGQIIPVKKILLGVTIGVAVIGAIKISKFLKD